MNTPPITVENFLYIAGCQGKTVNVWRDGAIIATEDENSTIPDELCRQRVKEVHGKMMSETLFVIDLYV